MRVRQGIAVKIGPFILVAQQKAQIALKHSLGGPAASHFAPQNSLKNTGSCDWVGVPCGIASENRIAIYTGAG